LPVYLRWKELILTMLPGGWGRSKTNGKIGIILQILQLKIFKTVNMPHISQFFPGF
jgi:hypothetical protein